MCILCTQGGQESVGALELEVQGVVTHCGFWERNLGPTQEVLLTTKSSLQPSKVFSSV